MSQSVSRPLTQRVEVDTYYTDGTDLWRVVEVCALGSVDLVNESNGASRTMGIDAFRRKLWRVK
jgi:hypothetical protein